MEEDGGRRRKDERKTSGWENLKEGKRGDGR